MRLFIIMAVISSFGNSLLAIPSSISDDEHVVFFTTVAHYDEPAGEWVVPIHGWVYEPEDSVVRKAGIEKVLEESFDLSVGRVSRGNFDRRVNLLLVDNERGKRIEITITGQQYVLNPSQPNGHFIDEIRLAQAVVDGFSKQGRLGFEVKLAEGDVRSFRGHVLLWELKGLTVISDIDDTVKVSEVGDHRKLIEHTFFSDFVAVPGMAAQYQNCSDAGADFQYVSSSPWQLYEPLNEFLQESDFPEAALSLKSIRLKDRTIMNLFKKGTETKPQQIEALMHRFPQRQFILVGDSGEQDPEVYAEIFRKFSSQIQSIYIRNVTTATPDDARFSTVFKDVPSAQWVLFTDASVIND